MSFKIGDKVKIIGPDVNEMSDYVYQTGILDSTRVLYSNDEWITRENIWLIKSLENAGYTYPTWYPESSLEFVPLKIPRGYCMIPVPRIFLATNCQHQVSQYTGFVETYPYCLKCGAKC